ncbi:MAG: class I SAM-dependent DNA methyltransferase, partial [Verrucomicrobia bacterium]|nr:class I SAM-dependent DNA methyltransferase [Verrucomicrobiota bacterium]
IPRYLIVSDFARIALHDLEPEQDPGAPLLQRLPPTIEFPLADLHQHVRHFAWIAGYQQHRLNPEDPANEEAVQLMCDLHDTLVAGGYTGHDLKRFLVRILFCLFADDTGIFPPRAFELWLEDRTAADGSDLGTRLEQLFRVLDTPPEKRQANLDESMGDFPYINGDLFAERLEFAEFNSDMRNRLLACCRFRWERISPAVFGSLFQSVIEPKERRQIGAHYTAERNILKLIRSLFLDELRAEFETIKADRSTRRRARLEEFQDKLARLRFLDPACGCGNFLVLAYRELRLLELEVLMELHGGQHEMALDEVNKLSQLDVDQFAGLELEEFPARIAEVALWLADHQMNQRVGLAFSQNYQRIPLRKNPRIVVANALRTDWNTVLPAAGCSYILGNPPFVGKQFMTAEQKADMDLVCGRVKGAGVLDLVTGWYFKAAEYIKGTAIRVAFVSTNSISQGEQPGILWRELFGRHHLKIHFAHRTFPWESESRGKAHVHVVIIGFGALDQPAKVITDYESDADHPTQHPVSNINPYLVEGADAVLVKRGKPLCAVPEIVFGSMPNDGGHLLLDREARDELLRKEPGAASFVRAFVGAEEFINGIERWCLWLGSASAGELRAMPEIFRRLKAVQAHRLNSTRETTRALAQKPAEFGENRQPSTNYLLIPGVSSESRNYIPIGFLKPDIIASNLVNIVPGATLFHFGVLTSAMHMAWVKHVCGRLKSDFRYSNQIVYNNFPWPGEVSPENRDRIEQAARQVLTLRAECGDGRHGFLPRRGQGASTLADLYDPVSMPPALRKAHATLDRAVDHAYRKEPFASDRQRVEYLFQLYEKVTAPLVAAAKPKPGSRRQTA